jgi:hypothetical protein
MDKETFDEYRRRVLGYLGDRDPGSGNYYGKA